ncbi:MAG: GNAT family N-acetyltransferase [Victivallales bacterium]|jgi:carbamoyl-phosphate synthase large subunit|nr:GNAT family N-acetyltransferase [Victivallales bacterium]
MNILLTSAGRRGYLCRYFKDALHNSGKVFAANSQYTQALTLADDYVITPLIFNPDYIPFLQKFVAKNQIDVIIPLFDVDGYILSKEQERFAAQNVKIITGSLETLKICNDKWASYKFFTEKKINTPRTFLSVDDCQKAITTGEINFPVIVKPRWGMGSLGIYTAETPTELEVFFQKLQREIFTTYLKHESAQDKTHCVIIQEKIIGDEFGLDVINDLNGNYVLTSAKRKLALRAGETDVAITVANPDLEELGKQLSGSLQYMANLDVDCFISRQKIYVLEMNCRFGGQYPFSHLAGVRLTDQIVRWLNNEATDLSLLTPKIGVLAGKEITPVRFEFQTSMSVNGISLAIKKATHAELFDFYSRVSSDFSPPLLERVNMADVAKKIVNAGISIEGYSQGKLVGVVSGYANDFATAQAYINIVAVEKQFRKQGIAKLLLQNFITCVKCHGMKTILLKTDSNNTSAIALYKKMGFSITQKGASKITLTLAL